MRRYSVVSTHYTHLIDVDIISTDDWNICNLVLVGVRDVEEEPHFPGRCEREPFAKDVADVNLNPSRIVVSNVRLSDLDGTGEGFDHSGIKKKKNL